MQVLICIQVLCNATTTTTINYTIWDLILLNATATTEYANLDLLLLNADTYVSTLGTGNWEGLFNMYFRES